MRVFVTGVSSEIGKALSMQLVEQGHEVTGFDCKRSADLIDGIRFVLGDIRDFAEVASASSHCQVGLHLAAVSGKSPAEEVLGVNVVGAYGFMAAAKANGFRSAVMASSAPVHLSPSEEDGDRLVRTSGGDDRVYDLSKALQEVIAQDFHSHGTPAMCLRLGHVVRGEAEVDLEGSTPLAALDYCRGGWVALEDVVAACIRALETAPRLDIFEVLHVVGARNARVRFNVRLAEERLRIRFAYDFAGYE